jgi:hypothetical protein
MANSLLNRAGVKEFIHQRREVLRPGWKCTQIAESSLDTIEAKLKNMIDNMLKSHPSVGKTFKEII